jgi:hypothetical protein
MSKKNTSTRKVILTSSFAASTALMMGAAALMLSIPVSNTAIAQQQGMMTNATAAAKPVDGYNLPQGHLNAVRHNFDDPSLRVEHFCKPHDRVMMVCQLYDSNSANATLIGIEYMITQEQYDSLPNRHAHREELRPERADPMMPELSPEQAQAEMAKMFPTWGKVIITWIPSDDLPSFPPQVQLVDHPFMVNATISSSNSTG